MSARGNGGPKQVEKTQVFGMEPRERIAKASLNYGSLNDWNCEMGLFNVNVPVCTESSSRAWGGKEALAVWRGSV